jgi:hypothetical protein
MSDDATTGKCGQLSLKGNACVLASGHDSDHQRWDGRTWPEGWTWADQVDQYFRAELSERGDQ